MKMPMNLTDILSTLCRHWFSRSASRSGDLLRQRQFNRRQRLNIFAIRANISVSWT